MDMNQANPNHAEPRYISHLENIVDPDQLTSCSPPKYVLIAGVLESNCGREWNNHKAEILILAWDFLREAV